jgi:hypothetical protein
VGEYTADAEVVMGNLLLKNSETDWKWVVPTALGAAILVGGILWAAFSEISKINDRLDKLDKHISRVETAVRILGAKEGGDTKTLIDEALTVAKNAAQAGHTENAKGIVAYANGLLARQIDSRIEASPQFFESAVQNYDSLAQSPLLEDSAYKGRFLLAEYRSALAPQPKLPEKLAVAPPGFGVSPQAELQPNIYELYGPLYLRPGFSLIGNGGTLRKHVIAGYAADLDMIIPPANRWEADRLTISDINVIDGRQSLDGFIWDNVTFVNMKIRYTGGTALLNNVRFVNCSFDLPPDNNGTSLANYVALARTNQLSLS